MLGSSTSHQCDRSFDEKVWKAVKAFQKIMKLSAKLMSIPPRIADKILNLKSWRELESAQRESLELCE
jgi:peptidoglycan hydrolase-like protein with peptidoglycan-binding domain